MKPKIFNAFFIFVSVVQLCCCHEGYENGNQIEELNCRDNATCINKLTQEVVRGIKENKTIKVFDIFSIEPIAPVVEATGRSNEGAVARFFNTHAVRVELGNFALRVLRSVKKGSLAVEIEHDEGRGRRPGLDGGLSGGVAGGFGGSGGSHRRPKGKKIMQVLLPMLLGIKTASSMMVAIAAVALLTFKAFLASKLALLVTGSMAIKKLMESFGHGSMAPQHQPYMYPMEFPAPGTHPGYSMPLNPYAGAELYGGLGANGHDVLQQPIHVEQPQDVTGQYSQGIAEIQNPNVTNLFSQPPAAKRWDGMYENDDIFDKTNRITKRSDTFYDKNDKNTFATVATELNIDTKDIINKGKNDRFHNLGKSVILNYERSEDKTNHKKASYKDVDKKIPNSYEKMYLFKNPHNVFGESMFSPLIGGRDLEVGKRFNKNGLVFDEPIERNATSSEKKTSDSELTFKLLGDSTAEKRQKYRKKESAVFEPLETRDDAEVLHFSPTENFEQFQPKDALIYTNKDTDTNNNSQNFKDIYKHSLNKYNTDEKIIKYENKRKVENIEDHPKSFEPINLPFIGNRDQWNFKSYENKTQNKDLYGNAEPFVIHDSQKNMFSIPKIEKSNTFDITVSQNYRVEGFPLNQNIGNELNFEAIEDHFKAPIESRHKISKNGFVSNSKNDNSYNVTVTNKNNVFLFIPKETSDTEDHFNGFRPLVYQPQGQNTLISNNYQQNIRTDDIERSSKTNEIEIAEIKKPEIKLRLKWENPKFKKINDSDSLNVFDITLTNQHNNISVFIPREEQTAHKKQTKIFTRNKRSSVKPSIKHKKKQNKNKNKNKITSLNSGKPNKKKLVFYKNKYSAITKTLGGIAGMIAQVMFFLPLEVVIFHLTIMEKHNKMWKNILKIFGFN